MKKPSLKKRLQRYLERNQGWHASGKLQELALQHGYTPRTAVRQLQLLENEGVLYVQYKGKSNHAHYKARKYKPVIQGYMDEQRGVYVVTN